MDIGYTQGITIYRKKGETLHFNVIIELMENKHLMETHIFNAAVAALTHGAKFVRIESQEEIYAFDPKFKVEIWETVCENGNYYRRYRVG